MMHLTEDFNAVRRLIRLSYLPFLYQKLKSSLTTLTSVAYKTAIYMEYLK